MVRNPVFFGLMLVVLGCEAWAQDASAPSGSATCLEARFAPIYLWAPINTTSASEGGGAPEVDVTDGATGLNGLFAAKLEIESERWWMSMGELYGSMSNDFTDRAGDQNSLAFKLSLFEMYGGYEVVSPLTVGGGIRFTSAELEYSSSSGRIIDLDERLLDPVVGVWYRPRISKSWTVAVAADVGGFGVGFDWSSSVSAVFTWRYKRVGADVGYRALYMKKSDDSGLLETTFYGPVVGFELFF